MGSTILITGGSGLIGNALTLLLLAKGYHVNHLSRNPVPNNIPNLKIFRWDVNEGTIDPNCIHGVTALVHLAGENISEEPWTPERLQQITRSRTKSSELIYELLHKEQHHVEAVISASAAGYYGDRQDEVLTEDSPPGQAIMTETTVAWEKAVQQGDSLGLRVVTLRTGVVLDRRKGALPEFERPIRMGIAAPLGTGQQWIPWIHLNDLIRLYLYALESEQLQGVFNACAPEQITNAQLTAALRKKLGISIPLPPVPSFLLKILLGPMSEIALDSTRMTSYRIETSGFDFNFPTLSKALDDLYQ